LLAERVFDDFGHPRLEALRNRMSPAQRAAVASWLRRDGAELKAEADALASYAKAKRAAPANDNQA
jgi:hypothetical protein